MGIGKIIRRRINPRPGDGYGGAKAGLIPTNVGKKPTFTQTRPAAKAVGMGVRKAVNVANGYKKAGATLARPRVRVTSHVRATGRYR
jgi:hypothetical protein